MMIDYAGASGSRTAYYAKRESEKYNKTIIIVSSDAAAGRLREDLSFFAKSKIVVMPDEEELRVIYDARDTSKLADRMMAMHALLSDEDVIVISPVRAALRNLPLPESFSEGCFVLKTGETADPLEIRDRLVKSGYIHSDVTESIGEFSLRGDILDIYSASNKEPVRIEFFGDEIESIRSFDRVTQRSIDKLESIEIIPACIFSPSEEEITKAADKIEKEIDSRAAEIVRERMNSQIYADLIDYFDLPTCKIWDYFEEGLVIIQEPANVYEAMGEGDYSELIEMYEKKDVVMFTPFSEVVEGVSSFERVIENCGRQIAPFNGQMKLLEREVSDLVKSGYEVHIVSRSEERSERLKEYLDDAGLIGRVICETGSLGYGMLLEDEKLCYITEQDIFPGSKKRSVKRRAKSGSVDFSDLSNGDYVVHEDYGIGIFEGIVQLKVENEIRDYLKIQYAGTDVVYIPTDQMDVIQKYIGNQGRAPTLSRLSGSAWKKTRARAKKAIMEIAEDLVKLYAEREQSSGHAFGEDTVWQTEFEEAFEYTETEDQLRAVREIKDDMEQPIPMDRLLCGDVGYGKTEVAARAIFKCISEGKQAVLLAPTTLLANQHYHTLKERLKNYPFEVEMLSRFRTEAEQKSILSRTEWGVIDLLIGTHRLLSDDVSFKDLGLLVVDEEQRFGVKHKEKIKMMRKDVDVLTLSATPIPRTLNMSLTGIKNISMIEEPPEDRYPVQTYVTPEDDELIRTVIRRELARGGQVFMVRNRVRGINELADAIRELVPEARVAVGHGQMSETALENVMMDFIDGKYDVLVATTIIENGIDIPNANTMIVLNSDMLGMSQLYQLRGRVGRSNKIAYAYLMYKHNKVMTELAYKRLTAIRDFTEFGAGFKLAMRDLELRGAGNILGEAQSGHIEGIGYELYCKEIDRAVRTLMGEHVPEALSEITIEIDMPARIPETYIENETLKLQAYKKIASIDSEESAKDVESELLDRYGELPEMTKNLIKAAEIRSLAERVGVKMIKSVGGKVSLNLSEKNLIDAYVLVMTMEEIGDKLSISGGTIPTLVLKTAGEKPQDATLNLMRVIYKNCKNKAKPN